MQNLDKIEFTEAQIKKMGYVVIISLVSEILLSGMRIALAKELKSIKMLINPTIADLDEDRDLLRVLEEPHVKLASALADYIHDTIFKTYYLITNLDDDEVLEDEWALDMGRKLFWRFMFFRRHHRRRDRYINFNRALLGAQRCIFELMKLWVTGETRFLDPTYRTNYSPGRVKALMTNNSDPLVFELEEMLLQLKEYELKSKALLEKNGL